jgi:hypothetical protein
MLEGWALGTAVMQRMMRELYGVVPEPWASSDGDDITYVSPPPIIDEPFVAPQPTRVMTKPRRLARGTESDVHDAQQLCATCREHGVPQAADWQDDALTRGRRSFPRLDSMSGPRFGAAA